MPNRAISPVASASENDRFAGIVLTEVNPNNAPDDATMREYVELVASGLSVGG